jgi:hypothetical protein
MVDPGPTPEDALLLLVDWVTAQLNGGGYNRPRDAATGGELPAPASPRTARRGRRSRGRGEEVALGNRPALDQTRESWRRARPALLTAGPGRAAAHIWTAPRRWSTERCAVPTDVNTSLRRPIPSRPWQPSRPSHSPSNIPGPPQAANPA